MGQNLSFVVVMAWLWVAAVACGDTGREAYRITEPPNTESVRGLVIDVQARTLTDVDSLTVTDENSVEWRFEGREYRDVSPIHVREHMLAGLPVTVFFSRADGDLVIEQITD